LIGISIMRANLTACITGRPSCLSSRFEGCSTFQDWRRLEEFIGEIQRMCPNLPVSMAGNQAVMQVQWPLFGCFEAYPESETPTSVNITVLGTQVTLPECASLDYCASIEGSCESIKCSVQNGSGGDEVVESRVCCPTGVSSEGRWMRPLDCSACRVGACCGSGDAIGVCEELTA